MCKPETNAAVLKGMLSLLMALQMRLWLHHALADEPPFLWPGSHANAVPLCNERSPISGAWIQ